MNNPFRLYDFPITFDPIQDDMTEEERRTLLITIIEELSNSGAGDALGSLGGANNASTKKLSEQAARLIEEHQRRHASNTAKIINDWLSIKYKWQNKLGSGASGGHVESVAAKQVMQSIDDLKHIDPHQSYVSTKRALNDVIRVGKFAGHVGTAINTSIALYSGDSNKVMKTITSIFAGILGAIVAGAAATAAIGGAIAGSAVAAFVAVAVIAATASYFSGKAAEWAWDNGLGDLVNDFFDKVGLKDDIEEFFDEIGDYLKDLVDKASKAISDLWDRAKNWLRRSDPLVLDLDGDGIELVAADGTVLFDHDGNRVAEATGWVAPDDGFLVIDKNGNGRIDDGSELFGDGNPDAFHDPEVQNTLSAGIRALRRYDSSQDGVFDAADAAFGQVRVWRDLNQDGVSQANELFTLADVGIQSIHLNPVSTADADVGHGNVADSTGQFTRTDGSQGNFYDMLLASNPFYRQFKDEVELTETARSLLDIRGSGAVRDLREAASLDEDLAAMVAGIAPGISRGEMLAQVDAILQRWADTSGMQDTEIWLRETQGLNGSFRVVSGGADRTDLTMMLSVLERFNGSRFFAEQANGRLWASGVTFSPVISQLSGETVRSFDITLPEENAVFLQQSYAALKNAVYGRLVRDARLSDYIDDFEIGFGHDGLQIGIDKALVRLQNRYSTEPGKALEDAVDLLRHASGMMGASSLKLLQQVEEWVQQLSATEAGRDLLSNSGISTDISNIQFSLNKAQDIALGENGQDKINGHAGMDIIFSGAGNDTIFAGNGNDILLGGQGNDQLFGENGNDTLDGGNGNDYLYGGEGNDTYLFGRGDGQDIISESAEKAENLDIIVFKSGVAAEDVDVIRNDNHLLLKIRQTSDSLQIYNYFTNDGAHASQIEEIRFTDSPGTVWRVSDIKAKILAGSADNDRIQAYASDDTINGRDGNDTIFAGNGNDILLGDQGNDQLFGENGNDTLDGGNGNDYLYGGEGNDTYLFGRGDGQDVISESAEKAENLDIIVFKSGVAVEDVDVIRNGNHLLLKIRQTSDSLQIYNYFTNDGAHASQIEEIRFTDSPDTVWRVSDIKAKILAGSADNDRIQAYASDDTINGRDGNDTIFAGNGNDILLGGQGNDQLFGENGNDILDGGNGNDYLYGGEGNDTYLFGRGDGQDIISESAEKAENLDIIVFKSGVAAEDIDVIRNDNHLLLKIRQTSDSLQIYNYFTNDGAHASQIEEIRFTDSPDTVWRVSDIKAKILAGSANNDRIQAYASDDTINGRDGNDTIFAGNGNDILLGDQGNDQLFGENGNDTLDGGNGNDYLYGGEGNDTYLFGRGDGQDVITDNDVTAGNLDRLVFKSNIDVADVEVIRNGDNLILKVKGTTDQVIISQYFNGGTASRHHLEEIRFDASPDTVWRLKEINEKLLADNANSSGTMALSSHTSGIIRAMSTIGGELFDASQSSTAMASADLQGVRARRRLKDFIATLPSDMATLQPSLPPIEIGDGNQGSNKWSIYMPGYPSDWDKDDSIPVNSFVSVMLEAEERISFSEEVPATQHTNILGYEPLATMTSSELRLLIEAMAAYDTGSAMTSRDLLTEPVLQDMSSRHFQADMSRNNLQAG